MAINDPPRIPDGFKADNPGAFISTVLQLGKTIGNDRVNDLVANPALPCPKEFAGKYEARMLEDLRAGLKPRVPLPNPADPRFTTSPPPPSIHPPPIPASEAEAYQLSYRDVMGKGPAYAEAFMAQHPRAFSWIREQHLSRIQPGRLRTPAPGQPANPAISK
jgi:hypothetical protein